MVLFIESLRAARRWDAW